MRCILLSLLVSLSSLAFSEQPKVDDYTVELYDLYCTACHAIKASGAPQSFTREWQPRMKKGIDTLVNHAISGIGNMPAMGTCGECTADDLEDIIRYMATEKK